MQEVLASHNLPNSNLQLSPVSNLIVRLSPSLLLNGCSTYPAIASISEHQDLKAFPCIEVFHHDYPRMDLDDKRQICREESMQHIPGRERRHRRQRHISRHASCTDLCHLHPRRCHKLSKVLSDHCQDTMRSAVRRDPYKIWEGMWFRTKVLSLAMSL